jgi:hypothetical protein
MTDKGETKSCPRCGGSGRAPADSPDEAPVQEPKQVPFFGARGD